MSSLNEDTLAVQGGIGEKMSSFIFNMTAFVVSIGVGFWYSWDMTLVLIAVLPLLFLSGALISVMVVWAAKEGSAAYAEAGGISNEALSNNKTGASSPIGITPFGSLRRRAGDHET